MIGEEIENVLWSIWKLYGKKIEKLRIMEIEEEVKEKKLEVMRERKKIICERKIEK